ncbi:MAG TPA: LacI family transcriptional regulator [Cyanobacteria bacterium UBA8803]|nr:LacI family transcriptional regulator [Cyanobacteria bacterium UBA9273]HBL58307.1 LacI family transcriptional regulator [Cyanobacteria bacterium UBA8803]
MPSEPTDNTSRPESTHGENSLDRESQVPQLASIWEQLNQSFDRVSAITDPIKQEYELAQEARQLDIPLDSYRRMFAAYTQPEKSDGVFHHPWLQCVRAFDLGMGKFVNWLQEVAIVRFAIVIGEATLLLAMLSFFTEAPQRQQQAINEAQEIIRTRIGQKYSQARIEAIMNLNAYCVSLSGMSAPKAALAGIELNKCDRFQFSHKAFAQWPPQFFTYEGINLSHADLAGANLEESNLAGANLAGANLEGANLEGANLAGANLEGANLAGANLQRTNLQGVNFHIAHLQRANLSRANLNRANLLKTDLTDATLLWTTLQNANLYRTNLTRANLSRANFQGADLYKANLQGALLRHADLRGNANLREAQLDSANLRQAKFWAIHQVKRAKHWETALKTKNWETQITQPKAVTVQIGLIVSSEESVFQLYRKGMELAKAENGIEIVSIQSGSGLQNEKKAIEQLIEVGVDAILLRPEDPKDSVATIRKAYEAGVVVVTVGDCINNRDAPKLVFACYNNNSYQMGYDSGTSLAKWVSQNWRGRDVNVGMVDGAIYDRTYPRVKGFQAALKDSGIRWHEVDSTAAAFRSDLPQVKEMLQTNPSINILWGGSNATTEISVQAVQELGLGGKVFVFGILDLTPDQAQMLLEPKAVLQSIIDQSGQKIGYEATKTSLAVLNGQLSDYQFHLVPHRAIAPSDPETIRQVLGESSTNSH